MHACIYIYTYIFSCTMYTATTPSTPGRVVAKNAQTMARILEMGWIGAGFWPKAWRWRNFQASLSLALETSKRDPVHKFHSEIIVVLVRNRWRKHIKIITRIDDRAFLIKTSQKRIGLFGPFSKSQATPFSDQQCVMYSASASQKRQDVGIRNGCEAWDLAHGNDRW